MDKNYSAILNSHSGLTRRKENASKHLTTLKKKFIENDSAFRDKVACIYCAGSIGRGEVGEHSDLDIFILSEEIDSRLDELEMLASIISINRELGYSRISNYGRYLKVYSLKEMLKALGAPRDDSENLFTARMLMILESQPVYNEELYLKYLKNIIDHYFRDKRGKRSFKPLFFINDLLRFWRTLCLNYELIRDDPKRPWRKKNINLKFSRMLTVFGTVLPVIAMPMSDASEVLELAIFSPHERFARGLDFLNDFDLQDEYINFLDNYETFLCLKEEMGSSKELDPTKIDNCKLAAKQLSDFIYKALWHKKIDNELKKFLVL